jgi:hypothetical protein
MPPVQQQRRRTTTVIQPSTLIQSKTVNFQAPINSSYQDIISTYNNKHSPTPPTNQQYTQRYQIPSTTTHKYQYT